MKERKMKNTLIFNFKKHKQSKHKENQTTKETK